ncbi:hypothetical protein RND81_11G170700 [Saponaria officinalis]|uniref:Uncharacterized protein n=1 Tax=Saponaria officinalis TaxID=3572 RepID=A0AAW1HN26_SAPOF
MKSSRISAYNTRNNYNNVKHKTQGITEDNTIMATIFSTPGHQVIRIHHRSKSEKFGTEKMDTVCRNLGRSNTEIKRGKKGCSCCSNAKGGHYPEDHMSNEEFKRTIEDFIAKQQRTLLEEADDFTA